MVKAIALYPLTQQPPQLATVITAEQMRQMPEFNPGGRTPVFGGDWFKYWFFGNSGLDLPLFPTIVWCSLGLPWVLTIKLPAIKLITSKIVILNQVTIASLLMFALAHILLPVLHLPNRFTYHSLRIIMAIATAIVLTILIDIGKNWFNRQLQAKISFKLLAKIKVALIITFSIIVIVVPAIPYIFTSLQNWQVGTAPEIYQYLAQQPKDILVASLSAEANNIPAFSQRSILVGDEFAYAYHPAYYNQIKQRTVDLLQAQYSPNLEVLKSFIQKYDVDYLLLDKIAFTPKYLLDKDWLINSSWSEETKKAIAQLESENTPALTKFIQSCTAISTEDLILFDTACIVK